MICIRCGHDSKHKERPNRVCPACAKTFAFEPQQGDPFTDPAFQNAIETISGQGSLRWGVEHLYWELARRRNKKQRGGRLGCLIAGVVGIEFRGDAVRARSASRMSVCLDCVRPARHESGAGASMERD